MNSNEAVHGMVPGAHCAPATENVREIFPGVSTDTPVVNRSLRANKAGKWRVGNPWARTGMEAGMATAEYAIATLAAVGFAGLLVVILKSDEVRGFLLNIIRTALSF